MNQPKPGTASPGAGIGPGAGRGSAAPPGHPGSGLLGTLPGEAAPPPASAGRPGVPIDRPGPEPALSRTARFAWGMVIAILIGLVALVVYVFTRPPLAQSGGTSSPTPPSVVTALAHVPPSMFDSVGVDVTAKPTPLTPPRVLVGQPRLELGGKPEVLFVGAEYCPFCAAERWSLAVALSRFGRLRGLQDTQSAGGSVFAGIQTFSFAGTRLESPYLSFVGVELYSDELNADGSYARLESLTPAESALVARYAGATPASTPIPFVDIGNRMVATTSPFTPGLLTRHSQSDIVTALSQPTEAIGQAVVAGANQLTAGLCLATGQRPTAVCSSKGVRAADAELGIP